MELSFKDAPYEVLSTETILSRVQPYDIFNHYHGPFKIGELTHSPFRIDKKPSFGIYVSKENGELLYNDYLLGGGSCIAYVKYKYQCSYAQALQMINRDFNLNLTFYNSSTNSNDIDHIVSKPIITGYKPKPKSIIKIYITVRKWLQRDKEYWYDRYKITSKTLSYFNVYPITRFYFDKQEMYSNKLSYAYYFKPGIFKIYQPLNQMGRGKWYSNIDTDLSWQGYDQLPNKDDILFITSSMKDVMVLYELGYSAIAPHTEKQRLDIELYKELKERFTNIIIYYDNDEAGVKHSIKLTTKFKVTYINNPKNEPKDPSDYIEKYNMDKLKELIKKELKKKNINV